MNLINILKEELSKKASHWSLFDKSLYLYIRTCEIFSYDSIYAITDDPKKKKASYYKKTPINNVEDFEITCLAWCRIYKKLMKELLNIDVTISKNNTAHRWCTFKIASNTIEADSTFSAYNDLVRAKNKDYISGFKIVDENGTFLKLETFKKLKQSLDVIGYSSLPFYSEYLFLLSSEINDKQILKDVLNIDDNSDIFDKITKKYDYLKKTLNTRNKRINDVIEDVKLLEKHLFTKEEQKYVSRITMYKDTPFNIKYMSLVKTKTNKRLYVTKYSSGKILMEIFPGSILPYLEEHKTHNNIIYEEIKNKLK